MDENCKATAVCQSGLQGQALRQREEGLWLAGSREAENAKPSPDFDEILRDSFHYDCLPRSLLPNSPNSSKVSQLTWPASPECDFLKHGRASNTM